MILLKSLESWYISNCNGDWEHEYGIQISTIDNPGWCLKIDLMSTALEGQGFSIDKDVDENDWLKANVKDNVFIAYGDPSKLNTLISIFLHDFLKNSLPKSNAEYTLYAKVAHENHELWRPLIAKMIDVDEFLIIQKPEFSFTEIKAKKVEFFEDVDFDKLIDIDEYEIGDKVKCDLVVMFDYPSLVINSKVK